MRRIQVAKKNEESGEALINLTPLIDVVFVILIMFILVAPLLELDTVDLASAGSETKEISAAIQEASHVTIHVRRDNSVLFNKQPVSIDQLKRVLQTARQQYPKSTPFLFHDKKAYFGTYQEVKNAIEMAGFKEINVILNPS